MLAAANATTEGLFQCAQLLVKSEKQQGSDKGLDLVDHFGNTALHYAAAAFLETKSDSAAKTYDFLVTEGADPLKANKDGLAPKNIFDLAQKGPS